ncbi:ubiquitin specific protease 20/33 [Cochliomyia hominivorax]
MNKLPQPCSHFSNEHSTLLDIKQIDGNNICFNCSYNGPNLWICLYHKCMQIGCSEQANDHSTEHFQRSKDKNLHCIHMNLSSQRAWCYLCEREVSIGGGVNVPPDSILRNIAYSDDENESDADTSGSCTGLVGLQNIANTCYMNSALQALSNVVPMTHYFLHCSDLVDYTLEQGAHRCKAGVAKSYQRLMRDMWRKRGEGKAFLVPRSILYGIRSVHPMFRGFQQHDTQEFLRCFMDQLHEELKEQTGFIDPKISASSSKQSTREAGDEDDDDTPSEMSSTGSSNSIASDYVTCDSSASEQSSLCEEPINGKHSSGMMVNPSCSASASGSSSNSTASSTTSTVRSIVSDIFDGKLLSSVQCLTCDRISTREETFQDLSLPIPNRDFLTVLHQTNSISVQSLNSIDSTTSSVRSNDGWLSWLWNIVRSWLWGPSVTLHDCMASFFSADELKGDNMYSCERCNKLRTGVKYSRILDLPEVLCIHLKRFRHDLSYSSKISSHVEFPLENFDMRSYIHKDCKSQVAHYNLSSVICHHGTVGGGHYTCFARNAITNRWYEFDDHHVNEVQPEVVQNCQAYVLFYHKTNPQMEHIRFEGNELAASYPVSQSDIRFYISREWLARFNTFSEPGPISNWSMLCPHGGVLHAKISVISQLAVPISQQLWEFLYRKFGGGPAINMLFECEACKRSAEALAHRQNYEHSVFQRYNDLELDSGAIYAVSMSWLRKWQQFARGLTHKEPGPINNSSIVPSSKETGGTQNNSPIRNVRIGSDYIQLNAPSWRFLNDIYGGGPEVLLRPSLTEEIIIIDQDELDDSDDGHTGNISDTESNMGGHNYNFVPETIDTNRTTETSALNDEEPDENDDITISTANKKRQKDKERSSGKKYIKTSHVTKKLTIAKGAKNKGNQDLFGVQGKYIAKDIETHSQEDEEDSQLQQQNNPSDKQQSEAFTIGSKTKKSFRNDNKHQQHKTTSITASTNSTTSSNDVLEIRAKHNKRGKKFKHSVVLKNIKHIPDTAASDSNETDI